MITSSGTVTSGSDAALSTIETLVSLRTSTPARIGRQASTNISVYVRLNLASLEGGRLSLQSQPNPCAIR